MRTMPAIALAVLLLLSGCASTGGKERDDDQEPPEGTLTSTATGSASGSGTSTPSATRTGTGTPGANRAPTGGIDAVVNGTLVTFDLTGEDPDGDALAWTLDLGDGNRTQGTELPAAVNHTFAPGNHTVVYSLTDGKAAASYNVTVNVTAAGSGPLQTFMGSWDHSNGHCAGATSTAVPSAAWFPAPAKGVTYQSAAVEATTVGQAFLATFTMGADAIGGVTFTKSDGSYATRTITGDGQTPTTVTGPVPAGATTVHFFSCLGEPDGSTVTYTAG